MTEQPRNKNQIEQSKSEELVPEDSPMRRIYETLCGHFGHGEMEFVKSSILPNGTVQEFIGLMYLAKANGVNPLKKECYLSIFMPKSGWNKGKRLPVFMVGIDGFRARSAGYGVVGIRTCAVCEHDEFEWDHLAGKPIRHISAKTNRGKVVSGWGILELKGKKPLVIYKKGRGIYKDW